MNIRAYLKTARLSLRPLTVADAPDIAARLNDFAVSKWLSVVPFPYTEADARHFITQIAPEAGPVWAICDDQGLQGVIGIDTELGYWLSQDVWGRGYLTEAARAVVAGWFADPEAGDLASGCFKGNHASAAVLAKLGFARAGTRTIHCRARQAEVDGITLCLTRAAYAAANPFRLETDRLVLEPMQAADATALWRIVIQPEVGRMLFVFPPDWARAQAEAFIQAWRWQGCLPFRLAIRELATNSFLGSIGIGQGAEPAIYYFLDPAAAGKGYATEAVRAFCDTVLDWFDLTALTADVFTDNPVSARILTRAGFVQTGEGIGHSAGRSAPAPIWTYRRAA